jgi:uncharacterized protein YciI
MDFDRLTAVLLILRDDAPELDTAAASALQDAHMAYLSDLHDSGILVAAGPVDDPRYSGISILKAEPDEARRLKELDPAVIAGRFRLEILPWMVPAGAISFHHTHFPRSAAEVM